MTIETSNQELKQGLKQGLNSLIYYDEYDEFTPSDREMRDYEEILDDLYDKNDSDPEWKKKALVEALAKEEDYYIFEFTNKGGLIMPIPLELTYENGMKELIRIPVEIWRKKSKQNTMVKTF